MPLTIKKFDNHSDRDKEYYQLALTHRDVMRYSDQEDNKMIFCVAHGPIRKEVERPIVQSSNVGAELGLVEGTDEAKVAEV